MTPRQSFAIYCKTRFDVRTCNPTDVQIDSVLNKSVSNSDGAKIVSDWQGSIAKGAVADSKPKIDWQAVYNEAQAAGRLAAQGATVVPMVVGSPSTPFGNEIDYSQKTYFVADGVCGFAGVKIADARTPFAKWLKSSNIGRNHYEGGKYIPIHEYNQSLQRKEAHAGAMAEVLSRYGVKCYVESRMD